MRVVCFKCGTQKEFDPREYRCDCGSPWEPLERMDFDLQLIDRNTSTLWRYK